MKDLQYLNKYFYKYKWRIIPGIIFVIISIFFQILQAPVVSHAVNLIIENITIYHLYEGFDRQEIIYSIFSTNLFFFGVLVLVIYLIRGVFLFFMRQTIILMSRHIEYDLKNEIYAHYQELSLGFYRRNNTGDLMNRATEDVNRVRMYVGPAIMYTTNTAVLSIIAIFRMFSVNGTLAFFTLLPLPLLVIIVYYVNTLINHKSERIQDQLSRLSSFVQERFSGIRVIKSYVREEQAQEVFAEESIAYKNKSMSLVKIQALFFPIMLLLVGLSTILTIYIGGRQVMEGTITPGNIAEFIIYINLLTFPVTMLGWVTTLIQRAAASQKRINEFLQLKPDIVSGNADEMSFDGKISFKNVSFTYQDTGIEALKELNFEIEKGQFLAIIGRTGSGKSTMANLLMRMYDTDSGKIEVDGIELKASKFEQL
jgi:ATP-binding cassette subfamily B multidrug efflux pump